MKSGGSIGRDDPRVEMNETRDPPWTTIHSVTGDGDCGLV